MSKRNPKPTEKLTAFLKEKGRCTENRTVKKSKKSPESKLFFSLTAYNRENFDQLFAPKTADKEKTRPAVEEEMAETMEGFNKVQELVNRNSV